MSDTLDIIINDARWASENPILALKRKPAPGALHVLTVGEVVPARLFFYDGPQGAASLSSVRKNGVTIGLFGKLVRKDGETLLFGTTVFTELQDARGDYGYAGSLDLLTDELKNAFNQGFDGTAFVDIKINGVRTHQFKLPIRPRTYAGTELDTHPAAEGLLAEMQAAAAEADADAAAANAAKVAAEGFRDEAQGFRNEAEGFKNDSEAARDESVAAKDISVAKAGEAATSATSAASSATTASTKAAEASDSADAAAASAASITFASNSEAIAGTLTTKVISPATLETKFANDLRTGMPGGMRCAGLNVTAGSSCTFSGELTMSFVLAPDVSNNGPLFSTSNNIKFTVVLIGGYWTARCTQDSHAPWYLNLGVPSTVPLFSFAVYRTSAGIFTFSANGSVFAPLNNNTAAEAPPTDTSDIVRLMGSQFNGYGQYKGDVILSRIANFAMTSDEALGASRNEAAGRLAFKAEDKQALAANVSTVPGYYPSSITVTDGTHTVHAVGNAGGSSGFYIAFSKVVPAGASIRLKGTVNTVTGYSEVRTFSETGVIRDIPGLAFAAGAYDFTFTASGTTVGIGFIINPAGSDVLDISGCSVSANGTVANYAPENCTSLNRWLDNSGNGYHLIPAAGVKAVNPQPVRERSASWVFNYATGSFVGVDASVLSAVHVGPGEVRLTVAAWIPIENILGHGASTFIDAGTAPPWYNTYSQCSLIGPINGSRIATVFMQTGAPGSSLNTLMDAPAQGAIRYLE